MTETRTVDDYDTEVIKYLTEKFKPLGVGVFDTVAAKSYQDVQATFEGGSAGERNYVVVLPGDVVPAASRRHRPLTGQAEASVYHSVGFHLWAESPPILRGMLRTLRKAMGEFAPDGASDPVETGLFNSNNMWNDTLKPVRYTAYVTYQVTIDRSA